MKQLRFTAPILVAVLFLVSCAPNVSTLKADVDAFAPLIAYEISLGHISQANADKYTNDGKLLTDDFGQLAGAWGGNKVLALGTFAGQVLPIANDFAKIPHLNEAMLILNTTVAILRAYYGGTPPKIVTGASASAQHVPANDTELNKFLKDQRAKLKAALVY